MEWVETTGRTIEEAKELALDQLGVDEADAEFDVVSEAKKGLFGRVKVEARVRARVRPATPRPKEETRRPRRSGSRDRSRDEKRQEKDSGAQQNRQKETSAAEKAESPSARAPRKRSRSKNRAPSVPNKEEGVSTVDENVALADQAEVAKTFLGGLLSEANANADISSLVDEDEELVFVYLEGENLGHLIGPRGATLQSLQELTRTVVQRKTGARNGRIIVDIQKYREKRRDALERFTTQVAEEVKSTNSERALEPMNPADRKVVHDTINSIDGVVTTSEGEEPRRRVVIKPGGSA